jgi:hypothetical protein
MHRSVLIDQAAQPSDFESQTLGLLNKLAEMLLFRRQILGNLRERG